MPRPLCLAAFAAAMALAPSAVAATTLALPSGGGRDALAVSVVVASREVRFETCRAAPCTLSSASQTLPIPLEGTTLDERSVSVDEVVLGGGRRLAHVRILLGADAASTSPAWEALLVAGAPPLFAGRTGWARGEPGERSGTLVQRIEDGDHAVVMVGDIREDLRICGDDATLLDPRGLDPTTMTFHSATFQRLSASRRDAAVPLAATPRRGPAAPALAPLLSVTDASSTRGAAAALTDGDLATVWSEDRPGRGQGEFVLMRTPFDVPIVRLAITVAPASPKPDGAAPETFYLATSAATYEVSLPEDAWGHPGEAYEIDLPEPVQTSCVALVLGEAFTRSKAHPIVSVAELSAYSAFDRPGATLAELATALSGGSARASAAAALLERAGESGLSAMVAAYPRLDVAGRALAMNIAASANNCEASGALLAAALSDPDAVVRGKATAKLQEPRCGRQALPALVAALQSPTARAKVASLVALIGREQAMGPLAAALGEGTSEDRHALRSALGLAAREAVPGDVASVLDASARRSAAASLDALRALVGRLGEVTAAADASVNSLLAGSPAFEDRFALVDILDRLAASSDAAAAALLDGMIAGDPSREVRARAVEFVSRAHHPEADALHALADPEPRVREAALRAVGAAHLRAATPVVVDQLLRDPWTFVRVAAASALATLPATPLADRALGDALEQPSLRVREQAVLSLAARGARPYRDAIRRHLTDTREAQAVREASVRALGQLCDARAIDALVAMALAGARSPEATDVSLGLLAIEALGSIHPRDLGARLEPLRGKGARPDARAAAAQALEAPGRCALP
jgi:HEAT repeat protein